MNFVAKVRLGWSRAYELQVFITDRLWLRLTRDPQRNTLGFWSEKNEQVATDWTAVATELDHRLQEIAIDSRAATDRACEYWPNGWEFWGPVIPSPLEATAAEIESAAALATPSGLP